MKVNFFLIALFLVALSCKRDEKTFDQGYQYYPLSIGNYKIYDVNKITYSVIDTVYENFQIKELIADTITIQSELKYRIERYKRSLTTDPWPFQPDSVWTAVLKPSKLISSENNYRYVKLVFPIENGKIWNINSENAFIADTCYYNDVAGNFTVLGKNYSPTVIAIQSPNDSNFVSRDYRQEVYAKDIGMIYKVHENYVYQQGPQGILLGTYKIDSGIKYYEKLMSYGKQ